MAVATPFVPAPAPVEYPDSDGEPMADNTLQFQWIVLLKENLEALFADRDDVFVAGDLLWYPVEGDNRTRLAPDAMVAFGRPKGYRGSYKQWEESGIAPQVVFEVLSPGNRAGEMARKLDFYDRFGVEEYYLYDPDNPRLTAYLRAPGGALQRLAVADGHVSPRLGIRFELPGGGEEMRVYRPDGRRFETFTEALNRRETEQQARFATEAERDAALERAARLAERLRALGVDPADLEGGS
jgi:Uma2 family endonuclease